MYIFNKIYICIYTPIINIYLHVYPPKPFILERLEKIILELHVYPKILIQSFCTLDNFISRYSK